MKSIPKPDPVRHSYLLKEKTAPSSIQGSVLQIILLFLTVQLLIAWRTAAVTAVVLFV